MKKWKKVPEAHFALFDRIIPNAVGVTKKHMFGGIAALANGNMFAGLHEENVVLRLAEEDREELKKDGGKTFMTMPKRPMAEYVTAPKSLIKDETSLKKWAKRALDYASTLPAKKSKPKKKK